MSNTALKRAQNAVVEALNPAPPQPPPATIILTSGDTITPQPIRWVWIGWLAKGKVHILAGVAGTGKTTIALDFVSTLTKSGQWPDGSSAKCGNVLIWSGEDDANDTLVPRLKAMGADMRRVHFISGVKEQSGNRAFDPARDGAILVEAVRTIKPALLIVDPIVSAVSGDSHKNTETRRALQPLVDLAAELDVAILGISHFSKGTAHRDPLERLTGSLAFGAVARLVMAAAKLPEEKGSGHIFCRTKSNIGDDKGGFRYDLEQVQIAEGFLAQRIKWGTAVNETAREMLVEPEGGATANTSNLEAAKEFLEEELKDGAVAVKTLQQEAKEAGHAWRTVERAKSKLNIKAIKTTEEDGHWAWRLPPPNTAMHADVRQSENVAALADLPPTELQSDQDRQGRQENELAELPETGEDEIESWEEIL